MKMEGDRKMVRERIVSKLQIPVIAIAASMLSSIKAAMAITGI
jgi:hypothetical protein